MFRGEWVEEGAVQSTGAGRKRNEKKTNKRNKKTIYCIFFPIDINRDTNHTYSV